MPIFVLVSDADDENATIQPLTIDDEMRTAGMHPDRRHDLRAKSGKLGVVTQQFEKIAKMEVVSIGLRLAEKAASGCVDAANVIDGLARQPIGQETYSAAS